MGGITFWMHAKFETHLSIILKCLLSFISPRGSSSPLFPYILDRHSTEYTWSVSTSTCFQTILNKKMTWYTYKKTTDHIAADMECPTFWRHFQRHVFKANFDSIENRPALGQGMAWHQRNRQAIAGVDGYTFHSRIYTSQGMSSVHCTVQAKRSDCLFNAESILKHIQQIHPIIMNCDRAQLNNPTLDLDFW